MQWSEVFLRNSDGDDSMKGLPRIVSILLLVLLGLSILSPLLSVGAADDASVPACCRRNGKHHCLMSMTQRHQAVERDTHIGVIPEKCPYTPYLTFGVRLPDLGLIATASAVFGELVSHPSVAPQTESKWRIARNRSRQKRGPPSIQA